MDNSGTFRVVCGSIERPETPYTFDVFISQSRVWGNFSFLGYSGLLHEEFFPFVLDKAGRIDFGAAFRLPHRFGFSNIQDITISVGATVLITGGRKHGDYVYRVSSITDVDPVRRHFLG